MALRSQGSSLTPSSRSQAWISKREIRDGPNPPLCRVWQRSAYQPQM